MSNEIMQWYYDENQRLIEKNNEVLRQNYEMSREIERLQKLIDTLSDADPNWEMKNDQDEG